MTEQALAGLKVVELGTLIAGPYCARLLAEFGAEVVKVETPGEGDPLRKWRKLHDGNSLWWYAQARNKKSVAINLKEADGQAIVRRLAEQADIVVENFRPGTLEKWNLGYDRLAAANPGLVMVRLSGFGQSGPYRDQPGFGAIGESMGGMRYITGYPDRAPVRVGISIGDSLAAMFGVIGALAGFTGAQMLLAFFGNQSILNFYGFVPVALGGMGSNRGAVIGGLALGLFQQAANFLVGGIFAAVAVFAVFIVVLLLRPEGLAGSAAARRV